MSEKEKHRFADTEWERLVSAEREALFRPREIIAMYGPQLGDHIADLGCGPGFWSTFLLQAIGEEGSLACIDDSPRMLDVLKDRIREQNVSAHLGSLPVVPLPSGSSDLVWAAMIVHEIDARTQLFAEALRVLKANGRLVVIEWEPSGPRRMGPPPDHRISATTIATELTNAGFADLTVDTLDPDFYVLVARKSG